MHVTVYDPVSTLVPYPSSDWYCDLFLRLYYSRMIPDCIVLPSLPPSFPYLGRENAVESHCRRPLFIGNVGSPVIPSLLSSRRGKANHGGEGYSTPSVYLVCVQCVLCVCGI